ncbi:CsbD family protein [Actinorhabdospora filicis]|uniref:CsbD family protein n=1 Tax=Actinorhabdospora filicis TaxID=1785913 RepID=A0A9W6SHV7_9ACTN|nr:CsbD family protein [Actinorhabdospora filicis]GLZ77410.1 CsbD family protein [Actinorhabdospora filicis]
MSDLSDKIKETAEDLKGKAKEGIGKLTGNEELVGEGQRDQAESKVEHAKNTLGEKVEDVKDRVKGFTGSGDEKH